MCEHYCLGSFAETEVWNIEPVQSSNQNPSWLYYKGKRCQFLVELHNLKEENLVLRQARVVHWFNNTGKNSLWMHRLPPASVTLELSRIPGAPFFFLFLFSLSHTILMAAQLWCIWIWSIFQRWEMSSFPPFNVPYITSRKGCADGHPVHLFGVQIFYKSILGLNYRFCMERSAAWADLIVSELTGNGAGPRYSSPAVTFSLW